MLLYKKENKSNSVKNKIKDNGIKYNLLEVLYYEKYSATKSNCNIKQI